MSSQNDDAVRAMTGAISDMVKKYLADRKINVSITETVADGVDENKNPVKIGAVSIEFSYAGKEQRSV